MLRKLIITFTFIALLFITYVVYTNSGSRKIVKDGVKAAETYWNAQKTSDEALFHSVTPRNSMVIVLDWSYVNKTNILVEKSSISNIRSNLQNFFKYYKKYENMYKKYENMYEQNKNTGNYVNAYTHKIVATGDKVAQSIFTNKQLKAADTYAANIKKSGHPMLGELLMDLLKGNDWSAIIPVNFAKLNKYKLMTFKYIADVKVQTKGGNVIQKRTTIHLYRMQAGNYDSGWKILDVTGLYN